MECLNSYHISTGYFKLHVTKYKEITLDHPHTDFLSSKQKEHFDNTVTAQHQSSSLLHENKHSNKSSFMYLFFIHFYKSYIKLYNDIPKLVH